LYYERTKAKKIAKVKAYQEKKKGILSTLKYPPKKITKPDIVHTRKWDGNQSYAFENIEEYNEYNKKMNEINYDPESDYEPPNRDLMINDHKKITTKSNTFPKIYADPTPDKIQKLKEIYEMPLDKVFNDEEPNYRILAESLRQLALKTYDDDYVQRYNNDYENKVEMNPDYEFDSLTDKDMEIFETQDFIDFMSDYIENLHVENIPAMLREYKKLCYLQGGQM
jgi:hypothetical protein